MKAIITLACLIGILVWVPASNADDIYSWIDKNGVKYYGNEPPENATDLKLLFKEQPHNAAADQQRSEKENREAVELIRQLDEEEQRQAAEATKKAAEAEQNRPPTMQERVDAERKRLENKIAELEEKPLSYFGSQKNKRVRIGYYRYRLEDLMQNPEKYFKHPTSFEGNVKYPQQ
jgi:chromosome segregation ATPase